MIPILFALFYFVTIVITRFTFPEGNVISLLHSTLLAVKWKQQSTRRKYISSGESETNYHSILFFLLLFLPWRPLLFTSSFAFFLSFPRGDLSLSWHDDLMFSTRRVCVVKESFFSTRLIFIIIFENDSFAHSLIHQPKVFSSRMTCCFTQASSQEYWHETGPFWNTNFWESFFWASHWKWRLTFVWLYLIHGSFRSNRVTVSFLQQELIVKIWKKMILPNVYVLGPKLVWNYFLENFLYRNIFQACWVTCRSYRNLYIGLTYFPHKFHQIKRYTCICK